MTSPTDRHPTKSAWMRMSAADYVRANERSRVLMRILEDDPADLDARLKLANLRRQGLDVPDYEWLLGFDPEHAAVTTPRSAPDSAVELPELPDDIAGTTLPNVDEWVEPILEEAIGFISVGLKDRARPLLEIVLHMQPDHDVARSWLFALSAEAQRPGPGPSPDDTLRIELPR